MRSCPSSVARPLGDERCRCSEADAFSEGALMVMCCLSECMSKKLASSCRPLGALRTNGADEEEGLEVLSGRRYSAVAAIVSSGDDSASVPLFFSISLAFPSPSSIVMLLSLTCSLTLVLVKGFVSSGEADGAGGDQSVMPPPFAASCRSPETAETEELGPCRRRAESDVTVREGDFCV